jgi:hypothetical protein
VGITNSLAVPKQRTVILLFLVRGKQKHLFSSKLGKGQLQKLIICGIIASRTTESAIAGVEWKANPDVWVCWHISGFGCRTERD